MKNLAHVPPGTRIFVDASILILYFTDHPHLADACEAFLLRCTRQELLAFTSVTAASETTHRVMVHEARTRFGFATSAETVGYLKRHPEVVRGLSQHLVVASQIHRLGIDILPVSYRDLHGGKEVRREYGLLTNDSLLVAVMRRHRLRHLATHDRDFTRLPTLSVWQPIPSL